MSFKNCLLLAASTAVAMGSISVAQNEEPPEVDGILADGELALLDSSRG